MAVADLWHLRGGGRCPECRTKVGAPSTRHGRGLRWRVTVGDHPSRAFTVKADAEVWEAELRRRRVRPAGTATVGELVDLWVSGRAYLATASLRPYKVAAARIHARWGLEPASSVTGPDVQAWVATMTSGDEKRPAAASTKSKALLVLRGALGIAVDAGMLERNPCDGVKVGRLRRIDPRFLTVAELGRLADAAAGYAPMVWMLGSTGLRVSECVRLDVGDLDLKRHRVRVRTAKAGKGRDAPLLDRVAGMLPTAGRAATEPLFLGPGGRTRVDAHNFRARVWRDAVEDAHLAPLRIHDLRHTAASLMISSGASVLEVQAALGHASAVVTLDIYGHLFDGHLKDLSRRMNALLALPETVPPPAD